MPKGNRYGVKSRVRKSVQRKPRFKGRTDAKKLLEIRDSAQDQSETVDLQSGPTHHQTTTSQNLENVSGTEEAETSASFRKITAGSEAMTPLQSTPISHSSTSHCTVTDFDQEADEGYRLIYVENMRKAMEQMHQFSCIRSRIYVKEGSRRSGLCSTLHFECSECCIDVSMNTSKKVAEKSDSYDINTRATFAMSELGLGREGLATVCEIFNIPAPLSDSNYQQSKKTIHSAINGVLNEKLAAAAQRVRMCLGANENEVIDASVSFDGTWSKRGYTASFGVGVVISIDTGEVIDYAVMSKTCDQCKAAEKLKNNPVKYAEWKESHKASGKCQKNYEGSSGSMEKEAAKIMWTRSVEKHNIRYSNMVCDGDSKAHSEVWDVYGVCSDCAKYEKMDKKSAEYQKWANSKAFIRWEDQHDDGSAQCNRVDKLDCIGHVQKRMGKNLLTLQKGKKLDDGKPVGGSRGRLTRPVIDRLQKYYGHAIRGSVVKEAKTNSELQSGVRNMQKAIKAVLYHNVKLEDQEERHQFCPEQSWCTYKNSKAVGIPHFENKNHHLDPVFLNYLMPIFDKLSHEKLLKRCLPGFSQNANESFNSLIWNRCPKHRSKGLTSVETAVGSAILQFNVGATGRHAVMNALEIQGGIHTNIGSGRKDRKRINNSLTRVQMKFKKARQVIRQAKLREEERIKNLEGTTYKSGAFNEEFHGPTAAKRNKTSKKLTNLKEKRQGKRK